MLLRLPANQLLCSLPLFVLARSQSILTCNSVKLREARVYFSLIPPFPELITIYVLDQTIMTDYTKLTSEVLRLLCQQSSLSITGNRQALISRLKAQQQQSKPTGSRPTSARAKRQKTTSTRVRTAEVTPETEPREEPYDQAAIPPPNANTTGEVSTHRSTASDHRGPDYLHCIGYRREQIGHLSSAPGRASASTAEPAVNLGDPNSVHQLLSPKSGDLAAHVDEKTRKAIVKGEYVDFVSLLHENSTASPTAHDLLTLTVNGESLPISFPSQRRARKVPIDSFDRWLSAFSVFFYRPFIYLSTPGSGNVFVPQHHPVRAQKILRSLLACL